MPKVPSYEGLRTDVGNLPQVKFSAPNTAAIGEVAAQQGEAMSRGLSAAGDAASRIALDMQNDANQVRVNDGMNALVKARTSLQVELQAQKGKNALERPDGTSLVDEYEAKLGQEIEALSTGLGNDAQRAAFKAQADQLRNDFRARAVQHMVQEQGEYKKQTRTTTITTAYNQAITLWGDPARRQQSTAAITSAIDETAKEEGWDQAFRDLKLTEALTPMHAGVIGAMVKAGMAKDAKAYYDENSMGMTLQGQAAVQEKLGPALLAQETRDAAMLIWATHGPKLPTDPTKMFDIEQAAHQAFPDDSDKADKTIARLRSMAQGWNAQQIEVKASNIAGVYKLVDDGVPMSRVELSDAWLGLDDTSQHEILQRLQSEASARESRALTADQRELTRLQIKEKLADIRGTETFLTAMDPTVLSQMSRAQVEALRSKVGKDQTEYLLKKWDELKQPGKLPIAKIDDNDFKAVAASMGMDPFEKKATPESKAALAQVRMDVETIITEREAKSGPLPREERKNIMRRALAAQVLLDRTWGSDVPVSAALVSQDELENVIVPDTEKPLIAEALATLYSRDPANPLYAPTKENMARMYLQRRMREGNQ